MAFDCSLFKAIALLIIAIAIVVAPSALRGEIKKFTIIYCYRLYGHKRATTFGAQGKKVKCVLGQF